MQRRNFLGLVAVGAFASGSGSWAATAGAQRIAMQARKFEFIPAEVTVRKGRTVTFVLSAVDFPHGFNLPDFGVRVDLVPGKTVEVTITPAKPGRFHYLCDNFCGDGHDRMGGILVVE